MTLLDNLKTGTVAAFICFGLYACHAPKQMALPPAAALPDTFAGNDGDTLSMSLLPPDRFFKDSLLKELINNVLDNNLDRLRSLQGIQAAQARLSMSQGARWPQIHAQARASGTHFGKYTQEGVGNFDTNLSDNIDDDQRVNTQWTPDYWLGLSAAWEVDLWGKFKQLKKAAQARFLASDQGRRLLESVLVGQTAEAYYELVALDRERRILEQNILLQQKALEVVEMQKSVGRATELAVKQLSAQLSNTRAALYPVLQRTTEIEQGLLISSGRFEGTIPRGDQLDKDHIAGLLRAGLPAQLLENRPDVVQAFWELEATKAETKSARADFFPNVQLSAYAAFNAFKGNLLLAPASLAGQLMGGATAPLLQQRQIRGRYKLANAAQLDAFYNWQKTVYQAYGEVTVLLASLERLQKAEDWKRQETDALASGIGIADDLYLTGYASYLEMVSVQKSKLEAESQLIANQLQQAKALIALYRALGGGWR